MNAYKAAKYNVLNQDWNIPRRSHPDAEIQGDRLTLIEKTRHICRNNSIARAAELTLIDYITGTELTPVGNESIVKVWNEWAEYCGIDGFSSWGDIYRDVVAAQFETGEVLVSTPIDTASNKYIKTRLQLTEADRIRTPENEKSAYKISDGVAYDISGREAGYYIAKLSKGVYLSGGQSNYDFLLKYNNRRPSAILARRPDKRRPGQTHQVPMLAANLQQLMDLDDLADAVIKRAQALSLIALFLETDRTDDVQNALNRISTDATTPEGDAYIVGDIVPGTITTLPFGTKPHTLIPSGSMEMVELILHFLRQFGAAIGLPLEMLLMDYSRTNFASGRLSFDHPFKMFERWNLGNVRQFVNPIFRLVITEAFLRGHPLLKGFNAAVLAAEFENIQWVGSSRIDADPQKAAKATETMIDNGLTTQEIELKKKSIEYKDIVKSRTRMYKIIEEVAAAEGITPEKLESDLLYSGKIKGPEITINGDVENE